MKEWEQFENEATKFLNSRFGSYARFFQKGGSDSTIPDIRVETHTGKTFYIEAKHSPAQCGQFVLLPDIESGHFRYSEKNVNRKNIYAQKIIEQMDQQFDEFREAGTTGKAIIMEDDSYAFKNWIIQSYTEKGVHFIITNDFTILPLAAINSYFEITAKYRIKRSGSSSIGTNRIPQVLNYINEHGYDIKETRIDEDKLFVRSNKNLHNTRFILKQYEYMFSSRNTEYEIRKLSNTYNANVIFSIQKKNNNPGLSEAEFIELLK